MSDNIKVFKLVTSEEIVAEVEEELEDTFVLKRPRSLVLMQAGGQVSQELMPWIVSASDADGEFESFVTLEKLHIMGEVIDVPEDLINYYHSKTSGIALV